VRQDHAARPNGVGIHFAFGIALKKVTGRNGADTYDETTSQLSELYKSKAQHSCGRKSSTPRRRIFTGYFQPVFEADGSVLAQKSGMDIYPIEMVRVHPDGREEKLFRIARQ